DPSGWAWTCFGRKGLRLGIGHSTILVAQAIKRIPQGNTSCADNVGHKPRVEGEFRWEILRLGSFGEQGADARADDVPDVLFCGGLEVDEEGGAGRLQGNALVQAGAGELINVRKDLVLKQALLGKKQEEDAARIVHRLGQTVKEGTGQVRIELILRTE